MNVSVASFADIAKPASIRLRRALLACLLLLGFGSAGAATIHVATSGNDTTGDGTLLNPYATIQHAYDQASDNDTINVMAGTYTECLYLTGLADSIPNQRSIHLVAEAFTPADPNTRALTTIDGNGACPADRAVVTIGAPAASIEGFTITGGTSGGIWSHGGITITHNIIDGNQSGSGGGLYLYPDHCFYGSVNATVTDNTIRNNSVTFDGPPLSGLGGGVLVALHPEDFNSGDPLTTPDGCLGGGGSVLIQDNTLENNTSEYDGGAIYAFTDSIPFDGGTDTSATITITQNTISGNTAGSPPGARAGDGGGLFATTLGSGPEQIDIINNQFLGNTATGYGGGVWAGVYALAYADHSVSVAGNTATGNTAVAGGGVEVSASVVDLQFDQTVYLGATNNTISGNTATNTNESGGGGGLSVGVFVRRTTAPGALFVVKGNDIRNNTADLDGGGAELRVIADAENPDDPGDTVLLPSTAQLEFSNNLIALNQATNSFADAVGGGVLAYMQASGPDALAKINMDLNTVSDNTTQTGAGGIEIESFTAFDTQVTGAGRSRLEIDSIINSYNNGLGIGGRVPGDPGVFTPGSAGGDTLNFSFSIFYSNVFGNPANYESWIMNWTGIQGNISMEPMLDSAHQPDLCSPTLDAGNPALDFSAEPDPDGGRINTGHTGGTDSATLSTAIIDDDSDGFSECKDDCDDDNGSVYLGADEICDGFDNDCDGETDEGFPDNDGDDVRNCMDNCPFVPNPDQADSDSDGIGDECDICPDDPDNDIDSDAVCGDADNCPELASSDQTDIDSDGLGDVCDPFRINFSPASSAIPSGYLKDDGSAFDSTRGYGWNGLVHERERGTALPLELDTFAFTFPERLWYAELENGDYDVRVVSGDSSYAQGPHLVLAQDVTVIDHAMTLAGEFADQTVRVEVRGGYLRLNVGGPDSYTMTNLVEMLKAADGPQIAASVNFQPTGSVAPPGYLVDDGSIYDPGQGYGWDVAMWTRERGRPVPEVLDTFALSTAARTWEMDLANGSYEVWLSAGDSAHALGPHRVGIEGAAIITDESTAAGAFLERHTVVEVSDGFLTVQIGGGGGYTALNQIVVAAADPDLDSDGVLNATDNCPFTANAGQEDLDSDGIGNDCDADADGDGTDDSEDNCLGIFNSDQGDADSDGIGDACETDADNDGIDNDLDNCPLRDNPGQEDGDSDGAGDACDNCIAIINDDQADADSDDRGDLCDVCHLDAQDDEDSDGLCADVDNCPQAANPAQDDWDSDGVGDLCDLLRVNFSPATSAIPFGYLKDDGSAFDSMRGYGWNGLVHERERVTAFPLELDTFAFIGPERLWYAELENGEYDVRVVSGDASYAQGPHLVLVQDVLVIDSVITAAGEFANETVRAQVLGGYLRLNVGGTAGYTMTNLVEAVEVPGGPEIVASVNFQPSGSMVPSGYLADYGATYDAGRGYGWNTAMWSRERGRPVPQTLDTFVLSSAIRTWEMELANGSYEVWLSVGDPAFALGPHRVYAEGVVIVMDGPAAANQFLERHATVEVSDGFLTIEIGGGGGYTALNQVVVTAVSPAPVSNSDGSVPVTDSPQ